MVEDMLAQTLTFIHMLLPILQSRETFSNWCVRKQIKAKKYDLDTVKREDIEITELICGISDCKLRGAIIKLEKPNLAELVVLGEQFDRAANL